MSPVFQPDLLKDKVALITGGGTGICRGIALAFAAHGCDVAITSRKIEHLEPTRDELKARGVRAVAKVADVREPAAVNEAVAAVAAELGGIDILINGAAGNFICLAENLSSNGFGTVVDIDLKGTFNVSKAALPHLKVRGGSVINISATLPYLGTMGQSHAAAAKAGVDSLTRTLACEWGPLGIRVNGIAPGPIDGTEGVKRLTSGKSRASALTQCPLGRLGTVDDIANASLYLASEAASYVNGVTLVVDGGLWLRSARILGE
ncbi:MAG: SDR family oxidoreductase [Acidobacteria bacterium]|nr:SDR family oxidoreductase [Acidobacteriota bacterium]